MKKCVIGLLLWASVMKGYAQTPVGGIDHVGLSVSSLDASEEFFVNYAGFEVLGRDDSYPAVFLNNGSITITLWRVQHPETATTFDRKNNVGLHHLAFSVASLEALDALHEKFKQDHDVTVEFAPELLGKGPAKHMMIYEPSGNRIEFIHRPQR